MKTIIITVLYLSLFSPNLFAQEEMQISKNAIELDLLNFDKWYNLNYSRSFVKNKWAIIPKVGIYVLPNKGGDYIPRFADSGVEIFNYAKSHTAANAGVDFLYGKRKHFLRLGVNSTVAKELLIKSVIANLGFDPVLNYAIEPTIGYRFQGKKKGLFFSANLRPFLFSKQAQRSLAGNKTQVYNFTFRPFPYSLIPTPAIGYSF